MKCWMIVHYIDRVFKPRNDDLYSSLKTLRLFNCLFYGLHISHGVTTLKIFVKKQFSLTSWKKRVLEVLHLQPPNIFVIFSYVQQLIFVWSLEVKLIFLLFQGRSLSFKTFFLWVLISIYQGKWYCIPVRYKCLLRYDRIALLIDIVVGNCYPL